MGVKMKLLILLWIAIIALSIIAFILVLKNEKHARLFSGLTVLISVLSLIISSISGSMQQDKTHEFIDLAFEKSAQQIISFVNEDFTERVNSQDDVIFKDDLFYIDVVARKPDDERLWSNKGWWKHIEADIGSTIQFCIKYGNSTPELAENVMVSVSLPSNLEYVNGSAYLFNTSHPQGLSYVDPCIDAVNIGNYQQYGEAMLLFNAIVTDTTLVEGKTNRLFVHAKISAKGNALIQHAFVDVDK